MEIVTPVSEKEVTDYDFAFVNGMRINQSLDEAAGDFCSELADRYLITLSEKPNPNDPSVTMPQEVVTIFKSQVVILINRKRKQRMPTEEEQFEMQKTLHKLTKTKH